MGQEGAPVKLWVPHLGGGKCDEVELAVEVRPHPVVRTAAHHFGTQRVLLMDTGVSTG